MRTRVEMAGHAVATAADGQEVLDEVASNGMPDLLLLDAMMPRKSGIDALRELRGAAHEVPALIVIGHQNPGGGAPPPDLAINGYITKPIDFERLLQTVAELTA